MELRDAGRGLTGSLSLSLYRSEGLPERDIESLCVMGWGLEVAGNSSAASAAAAVAAVAPPPPPKSGCF